MLDICLILEGSYPYVIGGVSSWTHHLIKALPHYKFGIVYIGSSRYTARELKYDLPSNVLSLKEVFIHDNLIVENKKKDSTKEFFKLLAKFYKEYQTGDFTKTFVEIVEILTPPSSVSIENLFQSQESFDFIQEKCKSGEGIDRSFLDYFWTIRFIFLPVINALAAEVPQAGLYHSISTGYAGLIGTAAKIRNGSQFLMTEHGLYSRERKIEIGSSRWVYDELNEEGGSYFKSLWINNFVSQSRIAYQFCDQIIALYKANTLVQIAEGANPEICKVIPNGVNVGKFLNLRQKSPPPNKDNYKIGFVGRVVSIKDVKTYLKAARIIIDTCPKAEIFIIGPTEEEPEYYEECKKLANSLKIQTNVQFTGIADVKKYYEMLDILVLTSNSEAQPIVILEANLAGIPCVATDVGCCRDLLEGATEEDQMLGFSGLVTPVGAPAETAKACLEILSDEKKWENFSKAGIDRVKSYYDEKKLNAKYRLLYHQLLGIRTS